MAIKRADPYRNCVKCGVRFRRVHRRQFCEECRPSYPHSRVTLGRCQGCGQTFAAKSSNRIWCNNRCRMRNDQTKSEHYEACAYPVCGQRFELTRGQWATKNRKHRHYCQPECRFQHQSEEMTEPGLFGRQKQNA